MAAAEGGYTETVQLLIDKGVNVNAKGKYGMTALILASVRGHASIVGLLADRGADINARETRLGLSALGMAQKMNRGPTMEVLRSRGARE
jgi:serine/threonine-protein phosphatase 6 regulatory ankyrin repeat subunit B